MGWLSRCYPRDDDVVEAPEGVGMDTLGPVEAEIDGEWVALDGTAADVVVAGPST